MSHIAATGELQGSEYMGEIHHKKGFSLLLLTLLSSNFFELGRKNSNKSRFEPRC